MQKVLFLLVAVLVCLSNAVTEEEHIERLWKLEKLKSMGLLTESEYDTKKSTLVDDFLGLSKATSRTKVYKDYRRVYDRNVGAPNNTNWTMPMVFTPQSDWLISIFKDNMPRSYDDTLPYEGGLDYWRSETYLTIGAFDYNGTRLPLDDMVAIQERALTRVGLNLYDGGVWSVALTLNGFYNMVEVYMNNVLYTSGTGANALIGGLKSIRAWEPNPDPGHPPDLFYYGRDKVSNIEIKPVTMPFNLTYIKNKDGCQCPMSGCCPQEGVQKIPGNYFYRMIGPTYMMEDPLNGKYGWGWRATPAGTNPDPAQYWNFAGAIHWNDWKPITGENVWGGILGPMQVLLLKNCTNIPKFSTFKDSPYEVQLAYSIMPAVEALISPLGAMYHCPLGTKMYPPDDEEETNVSNENNFSAYASLKAFMFIMTNWYTAGDPDLDYAVSVATKALKGLDTWINTNLLPVPIAGETVVSQGGHVSFDGNYKPQDGPQAFAVDCQTWGLLVCGQKRFDGAYGGKTTAYDLWQATKKLAGYFIGTDIAGVGYTVPKANVTTKHEIWSGEWTWGAVFMTHRISMEYRAIGKTDWANSLLADSLSMVRYMKQQVVPGDDGVWKDGGLVQPDGSYLYANKRFFIPWGWYANPIGATSSTGWAIFYDWMYNPFQLGGGGNTTFFTTQCKDNPPDSALLQKLWDYYNN